MATTPSRQDPRQKRLSFDAAPTIKPRPASKTLHPNLTKFLNVASEQYDACLSHIDHNYVVRDFNGTLRLHYVQTDSNGRPKFKELAQILARHIGYYAIMSQRHSSAKTHADHAKIFLEAKKLLRKHSKSGEPGELLLYFLMEAVLKAPQAICKMSLKTNRKEEVKGSDGLHVKWNTITDRPIIYFGEAKLYKNLTSAVAAVFKSLETFHAEGAEEHELFLAANHFNLLDEGLREELCGFLDRTTTSKTYEMRHACMIGFDWNRYGELSSPTTRKVFLDNFESHYLKHGSQIWSLLSKHFDRFNHKDLMLECFFIPFSSVQQFREWFMEEVFGEVVR